MSAKNIAVLGECMVEIQTTTEGVRQGFGGDTLNTAVYLARLAALSSQPLRTSYVTALGCDPLSGVMKESWQEEGIDTELVITKEDKLPGLYMIENRPCGERDFYYWRNDSAAKHWLVDQDLNVLYRDLIEYDVIYLTGITLAIQPAEQLTRLMSLLIRLKGAGCTLVFDSNYRPKLWQDRLQAQQVFKQLYTISDIALLTFEDEQLLFGDEDYQSCLARLSAFSIPQLILKMGAEGCLVVEQGDSEWVATSPVCNVVDTTAAGDSFNAGYLFSWIQHGNCQQAAVAGHRLAGEVIQHKGAIIPHSAMPTFR